MKAMPFPLPFEDLRSNGLLNFTSLSDSPPPPHLRPHNWSFSLQKQICYVGAAEPTSVLDTRRSPTPSPPTSTSTLSSSLGGGGGAGATASTDTTLTENPSPLDKCGGGLGIDDWDSVLPESPGQGPSILGLIMGDVEDPSLGLNKLLQGGGGGGGVAAAAAAGSHLDLEFSGGFSGVDHGFVFEPNTLTGESIVDPSGSDFHNGGRLTAAAVSNTNTMFSGLFQNQNQMMDGVDEKPQIFNSSPQVVMNQNQNQTQFTQNPAMFMPLPYNSPVQDHHQNHHHQNLLGPPPAKRFNCGSIGGNNNYPVKSPFQDSGQEMFNRRQQHVQQVQLFPHHHQQQQQQQQRASMAAMAKQKMVNEEMANQQLQQGISDQLFKAVELIETGNSVLAQGILARLNHQLSSPIGKPFQRAAFYFKEALQMLLHQNPSPNNPLSSPFSIIFKIAAYKSFSELSPVLQFANFTSNQALLEAFNGFDRIHIIDFDIGYGGQWASLMQELALLRNGGNGGSPPFLKITAFADDDDFELGFTQENLKNFANEVNIGFELEVVNVECLNSGSWPLPLNVSENEAIAVNLPVGSFFNYYYNSVSLPMVLRFVKHLSPKIVVCVDRGCNRMDAPFPHRVMNALESYSGLLESMDGVSVNIDTQLKIERYLLQPGIEKLVMSRRHSSNERLPPWRSLFLSSGFSPLTFSNFTESQAECLLHRTPLQGFQIDKRQSSLVLCWHRKELVSISAWRC